MVRDPIFWSSRSAETPLYDGWGFLLWIGWKQHYVKVINNPPKNTPVQTVPKRRSFLLETRGVPSQFLNRSSPPEMRTTGPLYLSCMLSLVKAAAHRSKQINHMMKSVIKGTTLEDSLNTQPHRLENCCRDFEDSWSKAMFNFKVTVHRNKSLDDYGEGDETEQRTSA